MSTVPTTFNPSDYQFLLKSVAEGNLISKAESLKRLNTLVITDKKQFSIYAKRVVISIQDLLMEAKEDVNLLACTLVLEIINLNPRQIEYYIRTKLLKSMVRNLGDIKPQIRKTSHYCLLAYVKTYKTFDQLIQIYLHYGFDSDSWQLRQKAINSLQSILIMQMKYLNWSSPQFKKIVQQLLGRTKDQNPYVQKAAQQCLVSICKNQQVRNFSKKLPPDFYNVLKIFCQAMVDQGMLHQSKLYIPQLPPTIFKNYSSANVNLELPSTKSVQKPISFQKIKLQIPSANTTPHSLSATKQALVSKIQQMRKKTHSPIMDKNFVEQKKTTQQKILKKVESMSVVSKNNVQKQKQIALPSLRKSIQIEERMQLDSQMRNNLKSQKTDVAIGRKLIDDLKNQKDWKIRLEAIEELHTRFNTSKGTPEAQNISKNFLPILVRLLGDPNFKVALISLKIIQEILQFENSNNSILIPQLVQKISDGKIALRQNISRLIRIEFNRTGNKIWLSQLLNQLRKSPSPNGNIKQQILNILSKMTIEAEQNEDSSRLETINNNLQQIVEAVCPLMDDLKTKIKIRTLDLLILLSIKTNRVELVKSILALKLNKVYFEMYLQKVAKQTKNFNIMNEIQREITPGDRRSRNDRLNLSNRRYKATGNTTSSTIRKHSSMEMIDENNTTVKTAIFVNKNNQNQQQHQDAVSERPTHKQPNTIVNTDKKTIIKSYRRKNFDYKSTQYSAFSTNNAGSQLPPFNDPEKQLKNVVNQIKSQQWQTCSEALVKLRRIIENHSQLLNHALIRLLVPQIMRLVQSLRSNLSKTAVITLYDLSNKMKKMLDSELDSMFSKLIKKTLDANSFISQQVRRALISICSNCNQTRVVSLLTNSHTSRALPIKISIVNVLDAIAFLPKFYEKQLQRIVTILANFLNQGSLQIRDKSKNLLSLILSSQKGSHVMKLIPNEHLQKIPLKVHKSLQKSQIKNTQMQNPQRREDMNQSRLNKKRKQKIIQFPQQFEKLQSLLQQCESSDWKNRQKNMSLINQIVIQPYPKQFLQHKLSGRVMDVLSKQIGDPNVKVASNALRILKTLPKKMPQIIQHNLSVLANQIFNCFGSHKPQIKQLAQQLFEEISDNIQKWMLVQHMCNGALYGLQKSRPQILIRLAELLPSIYAKGNKKSLLSKNLYPLINKLIEQNKPQNYQGLVALMQTCDAQTQGQFLSGLKPKSIQFYNSIQNNQ